MRRPDPHPEPTPVTKLPHKTPRLLLRGFVGPRGRLWCLDKATGKCFATTYEKAETQRHFYVYPEVERLLGHMESASAPVIRRVRDERSVSFLVREDRRTLRRFFAMQFARTAARRTAILEHNRWEETRLREIAGSLGVTLDQVDVDGWSQMDADKAARLSIVGLLRLTKDAPALLEKYIPILFAPADEDARLVIGDNPVVRNSGRQLPGGMGPRLDLGAPGLELYLPISCSLVLGLVDWDRLLDTPLEYARLTRQRRAGRKLGAREWLWIEQARRFMEITMAGGVVPLSPGEVRTHLELQEESALRFVYARDRETLEAMVAS